MGAKGFCFKHNKMISSPSSGCEDFTMKTDEDLKKRLVFEEKDKRQSGSGFEGITVVEKPEDTDDFTLPKEGRVKKKIFIDTEGGEESTVQPKEGYRDQGQNLFLAILLVGVVILIGILIATGVF
jgi:hypothetical protein